VVCDCSKRGQERLADCLSDMPASQCVSSVRPSMRGGACMFQCIASKQTDRHEKETCGVCFSYALQSRAAHADRQNSRRTARTDRWSVCPQHRQVWCAKLYR